MLQPEHEATASVIPQLCVSDLYVLQEHFAEAFFGTGLWIWPRGCAV